MSVFGKWMKSYTESCRLISKPTCIQSNTNGADLTDAFEPLAFFVRQLSRIENTTNEAIHAAVGVYCVPGGETVSFA